MRGHWVNCAKGKIETSVGKASSGSRGGFFDGRTLVGILEKPTTGYRLLFTVGTREPKHEPLRVLDVARGGFLTTGRLSLCSKYQVLGSNDTACKKLLGDFTTLGGFFFSECKFKKWIFWHPLGTVRTSVWLMVSPTGLWRFPRRKSVRWGFSLCWIFKFNNRLHWLIYVKLSLQKHV